MARTVNVETRAIRREAFVETGLRLIQTKGYEQMSVQDVLDDLDVSRGAFYHYFSSKRELLEAVVDHVVAAALAAVEPIAADQQLPAIARMEGIFTGIAGWKAERRELMLALVRVWYSDDNVLTRDKLRLHLGGSLVPMLAGIIREGAEQGVMSAGSPEGAARAIVSLLLGAQDTAIELFVARQEGTISVESVVSTMAGYTEAFERILGIPPGSMTLLDENTLRLWFGSGAETGPLITIRR
ncbi:MAG: TetR/AcrR family transcriptional regulator [Candidatus Dormibacteria bacterium]